MTGVDGPLGPLVALCPVGRPAERDAPDLEERQIELCLEIWGQHVGRRRRRFAPADPFLPDVAPGPIDASCDASERVDVALRRGPFEGGADIGLVREEGVVIAEPTFLERDRLKPVEHPVAVAGAPGPVLVGRDELPLGIEAHRFEQPVTQLVGIVDDLDERLGNE
ncbi:MAG: hypothetical protein ACRD0V_14390 [Acidimicrobiales bacterium]